MNDSQDSIWLCDNALETMDILEKSASFHSSTSTTHSDQTTFRKMLEKLNLGALWQWMLCICCINFDLDKGHLLEYVYPPLEFSPEEQSSMQVFSRF
jgi:hypothetical protein